MHVTHEYILDKFNLIEEYVKSRRQELVSVAGTVSNVFKDDEGRTVLTKYDGEIEKRIREILTDRKYDLGICGEEHGWAGSHDSFWTIDPIDGTEHFLRADPYFTCMIGLVVDGTPVASCIYNYTLDQLYLAIPKKQATCNGREISVSNRKIDRSIIECEFDLSADWAWDTLRSFADVIYTPQKQGAVAGYGFTQVARGASEARIQVEGYGHPWDYIPGHVLVHAAGGIVRNIGSDEWDWRNQDSIASNVLVADKLHQIVLSSRA